MILIPKNKKMKHCTGSQQLINSPLFSLTLQIPTLNIHSLKKLT